MFNAVASPFTVVKVDPGLARNPLQKGIKARSSPFDPTRDHYYKHVNAHEYN